MNHVTIKRHHADGLVEMEAYDTDTNAVSGLTMRACDLWNWLWERRPCQVNVRGRSYSLEHPASRMERWVSMVR
jgi:hypothetical protein